MGRTRPRGLTDSEIDDLDCYLPCLYAAKRLKSDDQEERKAAAEALRHDGASPEKVLERLAVGNVAAVKYLLPIYTTADLSDSQLQRCEELLKDDAVFDFMSERFAEYMAANSGLTINGVAVSDEEGES